MENDLTLLAAVELRQLEIDLEAARSELERIARRRAAVLSLLEAYGNDTPRVGHLSADVTLPMMTLRASVSQPTPRESSFKARVLAASEAMLREFAPLKTPELVEKLTTIAGIEFTAADPVGALSSILSKHREIFAADRKNGWSLAKESPQDVAASAGLDTKAVSTEPPGEAPTHTG